MIRGGEHRLVWCVFWLLLAANANLAAGPSSNSNSNLVIGLLLPTEQSEAACIREGVQFALDQTNSNSPVPVRVVIRGRVGQWGADADEAARMVTDDGAAGLIAPPTGAATHLVLQVSGRTAVPVVSLCADTSVTRTGVPWMVRMVPSTVQEARALLKGLQGDGSPSPQRCVALVPEERAGREVARDLRQACEGTGFKLQKAITMKPDGPENESVTRQVAEAGTDLVLIWLDPKPAGAAAKAVRSDGFKGILAGPGRLRSAEFAKSAGNALEGFVTTEVVLDSTSQMKLNAFETSFRNRYGREANQMTVFSYDAACLLIHILETGGEQSPRAFPIRFPWVGASGTMSFDAEGNRCADFRLRVAHPDSWHQSAAGSAANKER